MIADTTSVLIGALPVRAGRAPRAVRVVTTDLLVDLQERAAGVARVQLHVREPVAVELRDDADSEGIDPRPSRRVLVGLGDDHVAAVAAPPVEVALGRGPFRDRGHDLEQLRADGQQRVVQADPPDVRILVADAQPEHGDEVGDDGVAVAGDEGDLAQEQRHGQRPSNRAGRFSMKALNASRQSADDEISRCRSVSAATKSAKPMPSAAT